VPIIGCVFVLSAPLRYGWQRVQKKNEHENPIF
jgi:hypothetical protein